MLYRNDNFYGSGTRDLEDIILFELNELGNEDILDYLKENTFKDSSFGNILDMIQKYNFLSDPFFAREVSAAIVRELNEKYEKDFKYGLWLTDLDSVNSNYVSLGENIISGYQESEYWISDLGSDGKLFIYEEFPEKQEEWNLTVQRNIDSDEELIDYENGPEH